MIKRMLHIGLIVSGAVLAILTLSFSSERLSKVSCDELTVVIPDDSPRFMDEAELSRLVKQADPKLFEKKLDELNTHLLEEKMMKVPAIKNVEVYRHISGDRMDFKGHLIVEVMQRKPLLRVLEGQTDYYMDEAGVVIPANPKFTAHVMLITGKADEKFVRRQLIPMIAYIQQDDFWRVQIKQINVDASGELAIVPLVGDQLIDFGEAAHYREKLRNLKALYDQAFSRWGWDKYKKISLKYKDQVVCTRR
ncbi:cell division protein FtsQ/DivIB [Mangrovibacterium marinum]|uniref:Cell division protein FtsQ n=1 Tax=Mangrovibacterium marinum TaxID=1639118 RepID=A0A2T5C039_9BACT|nr:cell division protein FtsQ/DivIB [Mangrovibacterium marinum]PTN07914.1 cell division protein FtsQ [Mangrovibacterium marinum]